MTSILHENLPDSDLIKLDSLFAQLRKLEKQKREWPRLHQIAELHWQIRESLFNQIQNPAIDNFISSLINYYKKRYGSLIAKDLVEDLILPAFQWTYSQIVLQNESQARLLEVRYSKITQLLNQRIASRLPENIIPHDILSVLYLDDKQKLFRKLRKLLIQLEGDLSMIPLHFEDNSANEYGLVNNIYFLIKEALYRFLAENPRNSTNYKLLANIEYSEIYDDNHLSSIIRVLLSDEDIALITSWAIKPQKETKTQVFETESLRKQLLITEVVYEEIKALLKLLKPTLQAMGINLENPPPNLPDRFNTLNLFKILVLNTINSIISKLNQLYGNAIEDDEIKSIVIKQLPVFLREYAESWRSMDYSSQRVAEA